MNFKVYTVSGDNVSFADPARYMIKDDGLLVIYTGMEKITYGPGGWTRIVEPFDDSGGGQGGIVV